jgi:4-oxalocrotonate tautomerase
MLGEILISLAIMYRSMPVVHVELYEGRTRDAKEKIVAGITDVFVKEGVAREAVTVILVEIKKENYGHNGKLLS